MPSWRGAASSPAVTASIASPVPFGLSRRPAGGGPEVPSLQGLPLLLAEGLGALASRESGQLLQKLLPPDLQPGQLAGVEGQGLLVAVPVRLVSLELLFQSLERGSSIRGKEGLQGLPGFPGGSFLPAASDAGPESKDSSGSQKSRPRKLPAPGQEPQQNQPCQSKAQAGQKKALSSGSRFSSLGQRRQLAADFLPGRRSVQALQGRGERWASVGPAIPWSPPAPEPPKPPGAPAIGPAAAPPGPALACPGTGLWPVPAPSGRFFLSALLLLPAPAFAGFPGAPGPPGGPSGRPFALPAPGRVRSVRRPGLPECPGPGASPGSRLRPAGPGAGGRICCTDICFSALAGLQPERGRQGCRLPWSPADSAAGSGPHPGSLPDPRPGENRCAGTRCAPPPGEPDRRCPPSALGQEGRFPSQRPEIGP